MSLRDSFLKAGLVSKKDAQRVEQELRKEQKKAQGNQETKAEREKREAAEIEAARKAREEELIRRRIEANERQRREILEISPRQILRAHRIRYRPGPQKFWFRSPKPPEIWRLDLPEGLAYDLRCGFVALAWCDDQNPEVLIVDREAAARVRELRPELLLFWNEFGADPDPAEQLLGAL